MISFDNAILSRRHSFSWWFIHYQRFIESVLKEVKHCLHLFREIICRWIELSDQDLRKSWYSVLSIDVSWFWFRSRHSKTSNHFDWDWHDEYPNRHIVRDISFDISYRTYSFNFEYNRYHWYFSISKTTNFQIGKNKSMNHCNFCTWNSHR